MMLKRASFFAIVVLMISMGLKVNGKEYESPVYTQYVAEITRSFSKQVEEDFGLECVGSGGEMPYDVEQISVKFVAYQSATVEEARELEIKLTERLVQVINAHEKIKRFLRECPFPPSRAHVTISFRDPRKKKTLSENNDVELVFQARNRIFYQAKNPDNPYLGKDIKDESYEEALKIVQSNAAKNGAQLLNDL
ncbi:MAG: hypothetical protein WA347_00495 [Rhabdochlamydiaceae bacterium]|jgi:hypothetical protein